MRQLLLYLILVKATQGLLIRRVNSNTTMKINHRTARFGPQPGHYNVTGQLILSDTTEGCERPNVSYANSIVVIKRGKCPFSTKVLHAQEHGAVGVIIGQYRSQSEWIQMVASNTTATYRIPSIFVQNSAFNFLKKCSGPPQHIHQTTATPHVRRRLIAGEVWIGLLNQIGEYGGGAKSMNVWKFLAYLLLFIPTVWCLVTVVLVIVRATRSCINRHRRERQLLNIPIVEYTGVMEKTSLVSIPQFQEEVDEETPVGEDDAILSMQVSDTSETKLLDEEARLRHEVDGPPPQSRLSNLLTSLSVTRNVCPLRPHNDTCAVCLDEFEMGSRISILPCLHGFHEDCINPWLRGQSELCPMCKQSIFDSPDGSNSDTAPRSWCSHLKCCANSGNRRRRVRDEGDEVNDDGVDVVDEVNGGVEITPVDSERENSREPPGFALPVGSNGYSELPSASMSREQQIVLQSVRRMGL